MRGYWPEVYIQYCQGRDWVGGGAGFARPLLHFILWLRTCLKKRSGTPFYTWTKAVYYLVLHPRLSKLTCCAPEYHICNRFMEIIFYYNKKRAKGGVVSLIRSYILLVFHYIVVFLNKTSRKEKGRKTLEKSVF